MSLSFDQLSNQVIAAAVEVHKQLGPGFLESVYENAIKLELLARKIRFESQKEIKVLYNGQLIGTHILDLIIEDKLIIELKAVDSLDDVHFAQLRSYLRATGKTVGLLMNFNSSKLVIRRVVFHFDVNA